MVYTDEELFVYEQYRTKELQLDAHFSDLG